MKIWLITPENEGHELNYIERFDGSLAQAKTRARFMADSLQKVLRQGSITVKIEDSLTSKERAWVRAKTVI